MTEREIKHLRELQERDTRHAREISDLKHEHLKELSELRASSNQKAVDAALAAAKEMSLRVEQTIVEQIKPIASTVDELKKSTTTSEAADVTLEKARDRRRLDSGQIFGILTFIVFVVSVAAAIIIGTR
jgi:type VI protein secretion system component VasK